MENKIVIQFWTGKEAQINLNKKFQIFIALRLPVKAQFARWYILFKI